MTQRKLNLAILAAVDAGKTTLSESLLYQTGTIRRAGRVDHRDTYLDNHELEKSRGITIFSKMARMNMAGIGLTLLDTPGHVDFTAETERTLMVADAALLVVSAADGVTGHTLELWSLLERYSLPTVIFVNKMDQAGADADRAMDDLCRNLHESCVRYDSWRRAGAEDAREELYDKTAMCDETAMEEYLETGRIEDKRIAAMVAERHIFPCFFGSALKMEGIRELIDALSVMLGTKAQPQDHKLQHGEQRIMTQIHGARDEAWKTGHETGNNASQEEASPEPDCGYGARVYKISRDDKGTRLTWMRITDGDLNVREQITENEKITQIRFYSGEKYQTADKASAGDIAAVCGLSESYCGQTFGNAPPSPSMATESVLSYDLIWPPSVDRLEMFGKLRELAEEIPEIDPQLSERGEGIRIRVMGEVQTQILQAIVRERYGVDIGFGEGSVVYRETIATSAEGVGHFEPLRHYAEVHLYLEPGERGSGIVYDTSCPTDILARHWQRQIISMLRSRRQAGVLTGSELTDVKVTLISGRAHLKHTEGGDFRQAGVRALRQGLMKCESVLLEPWYDFELDIPSQMIGRALMDIDRFCGRADAPQTEGEYARITGRAPVVRMQNYQAQVRAYTQGRGSLSLKNGGYEPCHNPEEVILEAGYDPSRDLRNPNWSVFCAHGAGYEVPWNEVDKAAHLPLMNSGRDSGMLWNYAEKDASGEGWEKGYESYRRHEATSEELKQIFEKTYGKIERKDLGGAKRTVYGGGRRGPTGLHKPRKSSKKDPILLVDGYNIIFAWKELRELSERDMSAARYTLAEILSNYQGYRNMAVILVYDAYRVSGQAEHTETYHDVSIVYTKEAETADRYIEKTVHRMASEFDITVATSDGAEQAIIWGAGARRMSARELEEEIGRAKSEIRDTYLKTESGGRIRPFAELLASAGAADKTADLITSK